MGVKIKGQKKLIEKLEEKFGEKTRDECRTRL